MNIEKLSSELPIFISVQNVQYKLLIMHTKINYIICYKALRYNSFIFTTQSIIPETAIHHLHKELKSCNII